MADYYLLLNYLQADFVDKMWGLAVSFEANFVDETENSLLSFLTVVEYLS